ncbi:MAG: hypothetical protein JW770_02365 [Actinobacteria bacterium]|nr:hypothetical protein [Actinomycetota bacterium]
MQVNKKIFIYVFSIISILFGLSGAVLSFGGIFALNSYSESFDNIQRLSLSAGKTIKETSGMLKNSNETTVHIADSIRAAKNTISYTSGISSDSGKAFIEVAGMVGFDVLGFKPLGDTEEYFNDIGNNLIGLSGELETIEEDLEVNASDLERIGSDLGKISVELEDVSIKFDKAVDSFNIYKFISIIRYLLIYLGILNMMFILYGIMFMILRR